MPRALEDGGEEVVGEEDGVHREDLRDVGEIYGRCRGEIGEM